MKKSFKQFWALFLSLALFFSLAPAKSVFAASDINGHWAQSTIQKWVSLGYIKGYPDGSFRPDYPISRAEFVVLANKSFYVTDKGDISFGDVDSSYWAYDEIQKGVGNGYVLGNGNGTFSPTNMITRQEAAVMISRIRDLETNSYYSTDYKDYSSISGWAREYVGAVTKAKIMRGFPDGSFHPQGNMTRAEAVIALEMALSYSLNQGNNNTPPPSSNITIKDGDWTMDKNDSSLKNMVIKGDLIIPKNIVSRTITLSNITVNGSLIVNGGSQINAVESSFNKLKLDNSGVSFDSNKKTLIKEALFLDDAKITGYGYDLVTISNSYVDTATINAVVKNVYLDTDAKLKLLEDADILELEASKNADETTITFSKGAIVDNMIIKDKIKIIGTGKIDAMTVYVSGVKSDIKPNTVKTRDGASNPTYTSSSSSSGGGSSKYENLVLSDKNQKFDGNGAKYNNVSIEADNVKVSNITIVGDLRIEKELGNGLATLQNVDVKGKTYIYGGGKNSVVFRGCTLEGNIISDVSNKIVPNKVNKEPVSLKFDSDTSVKGNIQILGGTRLEMEATKKITLPYVIVDGKLNDELFVDTNITTLDVNEKTQIALGDNIRVSTANIMNRAENSEIIFRGVSSQLDTLNSRAKAKISGKGKIDTVNAYVDVSIGTEVSCKQIVKPNDVKVTEVKLNQKEAVIQKGSILQLTAELFPSNAQNKAVTWSSDNTLVATVDNLGKVTATNAGTANITVKTADGNKTAICTVKVNEKAIAVTGISLNQSSIEIEKGTTAQLVKMIAPSNASNQLVDWSSSNTNVALVDKDGLITSVSTGKVIISAITKDGGYRSECNVTVTEKSHKIKATGVNISKQQADVLTNERLQLVAEIVPVNAENKELEWSSSNAVVAEVDANGLVTAKTKGEAVITVKTKEGGFTAVCKITVNEKKQEISGVKLNAETAVLEEKQSHQLVAEIMPVNAENKELEWSSSNADAAEVDANGLVTAKTKGEAVITVKTKEGGFTAVCKITVNEKKQEISGVKLNAETAVLEEKQSYQLVAEIMPANAENKELEWSSSNAGAAEVDANGLVTAKIKGEAAITVKTKEGGFTAACKITVNEKKQEVNGVKLSAETAVLEEKQSHQLVAEIMPANAENKELEWSSSNADVAEVDVNGLVTAKTKGEAVITVKTKEGGFTAACKITVIDIQSNGVVLNQKRAVIAGKDTIQLTAEAIIPGATEFIWQSANPLVAIVSSTGMVTGISDGSTTITATTSDGRFASCVVVIKGASIIGSPMTMNQSEADVLVGKQLSLHITPAMGGQIIWVSSDATVATVTPTGVVTAIKKGGAASITAKMNDDILGVCKVTVK